MKLGQLLAAHMEKEKLTLRQFSKEIGVDQATLWRLMNGRNETCKNWPTILRWVFGK